MSAGVMRKVMTMSKPTNAERREVAENLRILADYPGQPVQYAEQFRDLLFDEIFPGLEYHDYSETFSRLADLIDPTCHQVIEDETQVCSECSGDLDEGYGWDFCPHCGARVVSDDE